MNRAALQGADGGYHGLVTGSFRSTAIIYGELEALQHDHGGPVMRELHLAYPSLPQPQPNSLGQGECGLLQSVVRDLAPDWSAEAMTDPVGETSLMIIPPEVCDEIGPLLVVHRVGALFRLDQFHWDVYSEIGEYRTFDELKNAVLQTLLTLPSIGSATGYLH